MTSVPPSSHWHPGPPPPRPELPDGAPEPDAPPPRVAGPASGGRSGWPDFVWWAPFVAGAMAFVLAMVLFGIAYGVADAVGSVDADKPPPGVTIVATFGQNLLLIAAAVLFAMLGGRRPRRVDFGLRRMSFWKGLGWAALIFGIFYALAFVYSIVLDVDEKDDLAEQLGARDSTLNLVAVALLVTVAAPLGEEFFFRGFMFGALGRRLGWIPAALVTGVIFGAIHAGGTDAVFLVPLMILGVLFCVLYKITGSLLPCMGLHALNNALALGVTLEWSAGEVLAIAVAAPALVVAIGTAVSQRAPKPAMA